MGETLDMDHLLHRYPELVQDLDAVAEDNARHAGSRRCTPHDYVWKVHSNMYVDAVDETKSNWLRFINHGMAHEVNVDVSVVPHLGVYLFANRKISPGEELLCDYGPRFWRGSPAVHASDRECTV